jgi:hypothetical protein
VNIGKTVEIKIERDRSLVSSPCLRLRTARWDWFLWWHYGPRVARAERDLG